MIFADCFLTQKMRRYMQILQTYYKEMCKTFEIKKECQEICVMVCLICVMVCVVHSVFKVSGNGRERSSHTSNF